MTLQLAEALAKRGRTWGERNAAVLAAIRKGELRFGHWPTRPMRAIGGATFNASGRYVVSFNGWVTRIPPAP